MPSIETIVEAIILVVLVVILFLQTWRAAVIPIVAIPVSLIGTFFFMALFGFSLNNLSLFGLVLAIGIVVDDAIVVVENVERNIAAGLSPREAAHKSMDEVGAALIAIALVLCAVFVPAAFITGISGQFYRQFALTIAGATVDLADRLADAVAGAVRAAAEAAHERGATAGGMRPMHGFFGLFNAASTRWRAATAGSSARVVRYRGHDAGRLCRRHRLRPQRVPQDAGRVHPAARRGYLIVVTQLPAGASLARTDAVNRRVVEIALQDAGRRPRGEFRRLLRRDLHQCAELGRDVPGARAVRGARARSQEDGRRDPGRACSSASPPIQEALVLVVMPPPVRGIGNAGGFRMMVEDRGGRGSAGACRARSTP